MSRLGPNRAGDALLVVVALAVAALVLWLLVREPPDDFERAEGDDVVASDPQANDPSTQPEAEPNGEVDEILVLGDESVTGERGYWIRRLGQPQNADVDNRAVAGIGYASNEAVVSCTLPTCPTVLRQLEDAVAEGAEPDLVLVSAGLHDPSVPEDALRPAVDAFLAAVAEAFPAAELVVINPIAPRAPAPQELPAVAEVVRSEASQADVTYIDAGQPYLREPGDGPQTDADKPGPLLLAAVTEVRTG